MRVIVCGIRNVLRMIHICTEVWKFLRNVKTMRKDRSPIEITSTGEWNTFYKKLLTEDRTAFPANETIIEGKSTIVTTEEVETAVKKL